MNKRKLTFYSGCICQNRIADLSSLFGFCHAFMPFNYLGVPLFQGKHLKINPQPLADRNRAKLATWTGKLFSFTGTVFLVKSVIHSMLAYSFHIYQFQWPKSSLF